MTCIICKVELKREVKLSTQFGVYTDFGEEIRRPVTLENPTGYHYCPQCGLVYKKER